MRYDPKIHAPIRGAANASKGIRFSTDRHGNPRWLIAERGSAVRRFPVLDVYDPDATPKAAHHGPGAFRHVVLRSDLETAERFADPSRSPGGCRHGVDVEHGEMGLRRETEDAGDLYDYKTGEWLRAATPEERAASVAAAQHDGGRGVIEISGRSVYVV